MTWDVGVAVFGVAIACLALIGPALVVLGVKLGTLTARVDSAHERMNRYEAQMSQEFKSSAQVTAERISRVERQMALEFKNLREYVNNLMVATEAKTK